MSGPNNSHAGKIMSKGFDNPVFNDGFDSGVIGVSYKPDLTLENIKKQENLDTISPDVCAQNTEEVDIEETPRSRCGKIKDFFKGTDFLVYSSHFLSAWGDRMWGFGVGLFLIDIFPESLQLTASYGLASGITILLLGAIIGDWVDNTPRLKAAQLSLLLQNFFVALCAAVVFVHLTYRQAVTEILDGWLEIISFIVIILLAILSNIFSIARIIAVERDWIVEICGKDKDMLAKMTATLRRIDLGTKILAPIATGQIMAFTEMRIGAVFIGSWNVVTVFIEYYLIWKVYNTVPALRKKKDWTKADRERAAQSIPEEVPVATATPEVEEADAYEPTGIEELPKGDNSTPDLTTSPDVGDIEMSPPNAQDDENAQGKEEKEKQPCCGRCLRKTFSSFVTLYTGWKTYMKYDVAKAGLGLSCLYMTVLGFDNITTGFAYSQGISEAFLGVFTAVGAVIGIIGTFIYPLLRRRVGLERTGLYALSAQISCLSLCVVSIWMPGSPFVFDYFMRDHSVSNISTSTVTSLSASTVSIETVTLTPGGVTHIGDIQFNTSVSFDVISANSTEAPQVLPVETPSYVSIGLLLAGIVTARFGLWLADLTITQLFMERVVESERGKVNGVQNSLNKLMDMLKFAMVVALPQPQVFGYLVLISFGFICLGFVMYSCYSYKARGHLLPFNHACSRTQEAPNAQAA